LRNVIEVRRVRFDCEIHDSSGQVFHVKTVDDLVTILVVWGADVDDFPLEGAREVVEALEGDVEEEGIECFCRVVFDDDVIDMNLGHCALLL